MLIAIATFIAYLPAMNGSLLWNDSDHVTRPELRSLQGLGRIWFDLGATEQYYPLLHSFFWIQSQLWGDHPLGYHVVNVLLHLTAVGLVYLILRKLRIPGALLAAAIFALHPVMVESVAWITEQKNTLSTVFYLSAMLTYLDFDQTRQRSRYVLTLLLFLLALTSKTTTVTLPAAVLVIVWWQRGRISWRPDVLYLIPFFALGIAAGLLTAWVELKFVGAEGAPFGLSIVQRGLLAGRVIWFYLAKLVWPTNLIFVYPHWEVETSAWWQWLFPAATIALIGGCWWLRRRCRAPLASCLFFIGTLFPVLGFFNVYLFIYTFVADHFQYLASLGMIVLAASAMALAIHQLSPNVRWIGNVYCAALLGTFGALTWQQARLYSDVVALYQSTISRNPSCWLACNNLGNILLELGQPQNAIEHFQQALRIKPMYADAYSNMGNALAKEGRYKEAIEQYEHALQIKPTHAQAHYNWGSLLLNSGRTAEAIEHFQQALRLKPRFAAAYVNLGNALLSAGRTQDAIEQYQQALELRPDFAEAHNNLGRALDEGGWSEAAIEHYQLAIQLKPDYPEAFNNLGNALLNSGQDSAAIVCYQQAVSLRPDNHETHYNLGLALFKSGRTDGAIAQFQEALRLQPDYAAAYFSMALAYDQLGRVKEVTTAVQKALDLAQAQGQRALVQRIEAWIASHRGASIDHPAATAGSDGKSATP